MDRLASARRLGGGGGGGSGCRTIQPRLRSRVELEPGAVYDGDDGDDPDHHECPAGSFAFSPNGSKFVATFLGSVYVFDVASLARLAVLASPSPRAMAAWTPAGQHILVYGAGSACLWEFASPGPPPPPAAVDVGRDAVIHGWCVPIAWPLLQGGLSSVLRSVAGRQELATCPRMVRAPSCRTPLRATLSSTAGA